ncbi:MAG: hypothetical protein ACI841_002169 [Planctomycetota bacterium]|jgi:hypothetical protein
MGVFDSLPKERMLGPLWLLSMVLLACCSCSPWQRLDRSQGWALYALKDRAVAAAPYRTAFEPAYRSVERDFGPFKEEVRVHVWPTSAPPASSSRSMQVRRVPGIGPARIPAWHMGGGGGPILPRGIYIDTPDMGTAVHELIHAHMAQHDEELPLWFEEGVASFFGDGVTIGGEWIVDGLSCWPLRELRDNPLTDEQLERLLSRRSSGQLAARDDLLLHFVGWAVVYDLALETGSRDWRIWRDRIRQGFTLASVQERLQRVLRPETEFLWLERLHDDRAAVRLAAAKGTWKLGRMQVLDLLMNALEYEADPEVAVGLAVNALAAAGELRLSQARWGELRALILRALASSALADPDESAAVEDLRRAYAGARSDWHAAQFAMSGLHRFWEE